MAARCVYRYENYDEWAPTAKRYAGVTYVETVDGKARLERCPVSDVALIVTCVTHVAGAKCSEGCPTKDHCTYGECMKSKGVRKVYADSANGNDFSKEKAFRAENAAYAQAVKDGLQPAGVETRHVRAAYEAAENN